jgi:hypothetical protein
MNLIDQIISTLALWQKQLLDLQSAAKPDGTSLARLEQAAVELGKRLAQLALQDQLQQLGSGYTASSQACPCGQRQRFLRYAPRQVRSLVGTVQLRRAYYRCADCGASALPLDQQLGLSEREISPGVERAASLLAAHLPFAETEFVLAEITGVSLSGRQIETVAESLGQHAQQQQQVEAEQAASQGLVEVCGPQRLPPKTVIIEMDGVQVGLQNGSWQEVKNGIIYELSQRLEISHKRWELLSSQRLAVRGEVSHFRRHLWASVLAAGVRTCDHIVVLGDGAEWIDQTVALMFPGALRILDYYHAAQRIWAVAQARFGEVSDEGQRWAQAQLGKLRAGQSRQVIAAMRRLKVEAGEKRAVRDEAVRYLWQRREQMRYDEYERQGLPIGSGAIESTCKQVVTARLKQAGMRWSEAGVDAMIALRCSVLNGRFDELCPKPEISFDWQQAA